MEGARGIKGRAGPDGPKVCNGNNFLRKVRRDGISVLILVLR